MKDIPPPFNIQIELVEGCNRMCSFCGIYGIWKNPKYRKIHFMNKSLIGNIALDLGAWFPNGRRIEFAMHGEPLLHPDLVWVISKFRKHNPKSQLQVTTNGILLTTKLIKELFVAGLNILIVDLYTKKGAILPKLRNSKIEIVDYYNTDFNPYHFHRKLPQKIVCMFDLRAFNKKRKTRVITNHAGNARHTSPMIPLKKKCDKPFRELSIHYDGTIPGCCMDWRHELIIGKLNYKKRVITKTIWESQGMCCLRKLLYNKNRNTLPCYICDYAGGFRLGFLQPQEEPTKEDLKKWVRMREKNKKYNHKHGRKCLTFEEFKKSKRANF